MYQKFIHDYKRNADASTRMMSTEFGTAVPAHQAMPRRPRRPLVPIGLQALLPPPLPPRPSQIGWRLTPLRPSPSPPILNRPATPTRAKHSDCHSSIRSQPPATPTMWPKPIPISNLRPLFPLWRRGQICLAHPPLLLYISPCRWRARARIVRHLRHPDPVRTAPM